MRRPSRAMLFFILAVLIGAAGWLLLAHRRAQEPLPYRNENVILITVDALRPDHLGCYGYPRPTSPRLDAWARHGVIFKNTIAQASWTMPGLISMMTGLLPPAHGVQIRGQYLLPVIPTIPKILQRYGYATPNLTYLTAEPSFVNLGYSPQSQNLAYLLNQNVVAQYVAAHPRQKFFIWYHYRFVHLPYDPPPRYEKLFLDEDRLAPDQRKRIRQVKTQVLFSPRTAHFLPADAGPIRSLYDADIRRFDDFFGEILLALDRAGIRNNTILIVSADHGEELFDHGWIGHSSSGYRATLYDELIKIPLIIVAPHLLPAGVVFDPPVRQIDILPTLLDLLGIPVPRDVQGRSLVPYATGKARYTEEPAFSETAIQGYRTRPKDALFRIMSLRTSGWKLIRHLDRSGTHVELYDLTRDPKERHDLAEELPKRVKDMEKQLSGVFLRSFAINTRFETEWEKAAASAPGGHGHFATPEIASPLENQRLDFGPERGYVVIRWKGPPSLSYEVQYDIGKKIYRLKGSVLIEGNSHAFGPFEAENWNLFRLWNPFRFRVRVVGGRSGWSGWRTFYIRGPRG